MGDHSSLAPGDASYKDQVAPPPGQVSCHWCLAGHVTSILTSDWSGGGHAAQRELLRPGRGQPQQLQHRPQCHHRHRNQVHHHYHYHYHHYHHHDTTQPPDPEHPDLRRCLLPAGQEQDGLPVQPPQDRALKLRWAKRDVCQKYFTHTPSRPPDPDPPRPPLQPEQQRQPGRAAAAASVQQASVRLQSAQPARCRTVGRKISARM